MDFVSHPENILAAQEVDVERKHFSIELRENGRGVFLRITETAAGRRNSVIDPGTGLGDFVAALKAVAEPEAAAAPQA